MITWLLTVSPFPEKLQTGLKYIPLCEHFKYLWVYLAKAYVSLTLNGNSVLWNAIMQSNYTMEIFTWNYFVSPTRWVTCVIIQCLTLGKAVRGASPCAVTNLVVAQGRLVKYCTKQMGEYTVEYTLHQMTRKNTYYHMSNSRKCMGVSGEALQPQAVYEKPYFFTVSCATVHLNTTSHVRIRIRYYKLHVLRLNVQWNRRFVW